MPPLDAEQAAAIDAVTMACRLCQAVHAEMVSPDTLAKKDRSPVTVADYGAQALVGAALAAAGRPEPLVAEEDAAALRDPANATTAERVFAQVRALRPAMSADAILAAIDRGAHPGGRDGRFWALDPIDGTKGFLRREQYAVALALVENGEVILGVLGCPNLPLDAAKPDGPAGCLFVAARGGGAQMRPLAGGPERQVHVTSVADVADAVVCESVESGHTSHGRAASVAQRLGITAPPLRMDSQCKYAAVARGDASIYLRLPTRADYEERIWDHAAGWMVIHEAGGEVTDVDGRPLDFGLGRTLRANRGVVATNGRIHDAVIAAVRAARG